MKTAMPHPQTRLVALLDWTVLGVGILSLSVAVAATLLTPAPDIRADDRPAATRAAG